MAVEVKHRRFRCPATRAAAWILLTIQIAACGALQPREIRKIALLAPFEGQYRDLGYNALYAVRLALAETDIENVQLLPVDDGGDLSSTNSRIRALNLDSAVVAIIALGEAATHPSTQRSNDKPMLIIGNWGHQRADEDSLYASARERVQSGAQDDLLIARRLISGDDSPQAFFSSNGALPDAQFSARYLGGDQHKPDPNWLATLTFDLARMALVSVANGSKLSDLALDGLNGNISFTDGYWQAAPIYRYQFQGQRLAPLSD